MVENDMTTLHVMNWEGLPLRVEEDEAEQTIDIIKKRMKNQRDVMKCNDAMIGKDNEKDVPLGPRLMKLLNNACIHWRAPIPV